MKVEKELKSLPLPTMYKREGKDCYYDPYRKKLSEITPEETVRQRVAAYFEQVCGVPHEMIVLEAPLSNYVEGAVGRADIVIHGYEKDTDSFYPLAIIECKKEDVFLTDRVVDQAMRYCDVLCGQYFVITNGIDMRMYAYHEEKDAYARMEEILSYRQMLNDKPELPKYTDEKLQRFSTKDLKNQGLLWTYNEQSEWIFGEDSGPRVRSFAVNFYQALLDTDHRLPAKKFKTFEMQEDCGLRFMDYSNAGGGHYVGVYRSFLVKDRCNEAQMVSVSIFGTDAQFRGEPRGSYTSLVVAIDRFKTSHNALQYNVDRYAWAYPNGIIKFLHSGRIGSFKCTDVIDMVEKNGDCVKVTDGSIELGVLHINKLLYLDNPETANFIYRLIEYALLREEVRRVVKKTKKDKETVDTK